MNPKKALITALLSASALAALYTPASAQSSGAGSGVAMLDEVVVTARKREESLQEVPVAVTAFSAESLREKNITSSYDVPLHTPGLTVRSASSQRGSADYFIRGQGSTFGSGPGVVSYFAEAPTFSTIAGNTLNFYDIASIQVLKGPQGTLFGRSTTGGAVLIEPQRPTNEFEGFLEGKIGNFDYREVTGAINIPVIEDRLMVRLAGNIIRREGFTTSSTTGQDLDDKHRESFRVGVLVRPTDWLENYSLLHTLDVNENSTGSVLINFNERIPQFDTSANGIGRLTVLGLCAAINPGPLAVNIPSCVATRVARLDALRNGLQAEENRVRGGGDIRQTPTAVEDFLRVKAQVFQNVTTLSFDDTPLGDIEIKNIFAADHYTGAVVTREIGGSPVPHAVVVNNQEIGPSNQLLVTDRSASQDWGDHITNEFQVSGSSTMLDWIVGYYYEKTKRDFGTPPVFTTFNNAFSVPLDAYAYLTPISVDTESENTGIFAQATVRLDALVTGLAVTGGYRRSTATSSGFTTPAILTPAGTTIGAVRNPTQGIDEEVDSFNVSVDWKVTPDLLVYVTHRKGYKPGGRNVLPVTPLPGSRPTFDPEILKDIEGGVKYTWNTDALRGRSNLAVYTQEYTDIQRNQILVATTPPFGTQTQVNNIAGASLYGLELENVLQIGERWTLTANYAYTHAEYDEYPGFTTNVLGQVIPNIQSPFVGTPENQVTLGVRYLALQSEEMGDISLSADYYYQSEVELDDQSLQDPERIGLQEGWSNINLRADWTNVMGRPVDAALFVRNVTDDEHLLGAGSLFNNLGVITGIYSEPRTYGLELRWRFGGE